MTNTHLGPYTLLRRLGAGGMGEVWIACRSGLGGAAKLVAIKTVLPQNTSNPESRRLFLDDASRRSIDGLPHLRDVGDPGHRRARAPPRGPASAESVEVARL